MEKDTRLIIFLSLIIMFFIPTCTAGQNSLKEEVNGDLKELIQNVPGSEKYPEAGIIEILDERIDEVSEDGKCKSMIHTIFKIIHEKGKKETDIEIGFNSLTEKANLLYARTVTPEGRIIHLKKDAVEIKTPYESFPSYSDYKLLAFSMPGVTIGSIIEYKILIEEKKPTMKGKFSRRFYFQWNYPKIHSKYSVITPPGMKLKYHILNPLNDIRTTPITTNNGKKVTYQWEFKNIPQIIHEIKMPPYKEVAFGIMVTNLNSWDEFSDWWGNLVVGKTDPNLKIKEKVKELTRGLQSEQEKTEVIFEYVWRNIRYVSINLGKSGLEPHKAAEVMENQYGDCKDKSTLLISMLNAAGIPAYYALIQSGRGTNILKEFPYPFQFNHCIVALEKGGRFVFLDPVESNYKTDYIPWNIQNKDALISKGNRGIFWKTSSARPEENSLLFMIRMNINGDGQIIGDTTISATGDEEAGLRSSFIQKSELEIRKTFENIFQQDMPGSILQKIEHSNPTNMKEVFKVNITFSVDGYCRKAGDLLILPSIDNKDDCLGIQSRKRIYPIKIESKYFVAIEVDFNIPDGYEIYFVPNSEKFKIKLIEGRSVYQVDGKRVTFKREFIAKETAIAPYEYDDYKKICEAISKSAKHEILFREIKR